MRKNERIRIGNESYTSPVAAIITIPETLSFLKQGFSADLEIDLDIDDIDDVGEL